MRRADLERIEAIAAKVGFRFRHAAGMDMLLYGHTNSDRNAVHLLFAGEKVRPEQAAPHPSINPERKRIHGNEVFVIPLPDLAADEAKFLPR